MSTILDSINSLIGSQIINQDQKLHGPKHQGPMEKLAAAQRKIDEATNEDLQEEDPDANPFPTNKVIGAPI